jgi:signal transduction histidine kinase
VENSLPAEIWLALEQLDKAEGIAKIDLLISLAGYYIEKDNARASKYAESSMKLSQDISDAERLAQSYLLLGKSSYFDLDFISAVEHLTNASLLFKSLNNKAKEIEALTISGISQSALGDHSRGLDSHYKSLKLCQEISDTKGERHSLMQIGLSYLGNKETSLALEYLTQAYEMAMKEGDRRELASVTGNLGNLYVILQEYDKAIEHYNNCKIIFEELDRPIEVGRAHLNIAIGLGASGKYDSALESVNKALPIFIKHNRKEQICYSYSTMGSIYGDQKDNEKAMEYLEKALQIGEQYNLKQILENIYGAISDTAANMEDYKKAYEFYLKYHDSVAARLNKSSEVKTRYLNVAHKVDTLKKESDELSAKNAELKELNERLTVLNLEKNEFLGIAAHDLKNPLSSISLSASTIKKYLGVFPKEKIEQHLDKIAETSSRMKNIVTNLINMNAIEAGEYIVKKDTIDLTALLNYIVEDFQHRASNKNIEIVLTADEDVKIITDENAVYSILDNLISNAVKYSSEGSYVFVKLLKTDKVTIKIKDNGLGIKESEKERVFRKFSRMSNKPTGGENSTGLGLSIVKKLTELIDGKIIFESEYGKGTEFIVELQV